jgi:Flp pilus assembly protein TadB
MPLPLMILTPDQRMRSARQAATSASMRTQAPLQSSSGMRVRRAWALGLRLACLCMLIQLQAAYLLLLALLRLTGCFVFLVVRLAA